jgi:4-hydroxybenzoate decarboxylase
VHRNKKPAGQPNGMAHKMIIDATTPIAPDRRGDYGEVLDTPQQTEQWQQKLTTMIAELRKIRYP